MELEMKLKSLQGSHCNIMSKHSNQMIEDDIDEDDVLEPIQYQYNDMEDVI